MATAESCSFEFRKDLHSSTSTTLARAQRLPEEDLHQSVGYFAAHTVDDLARSVDVLENGPHRVRDCISTVFEEEFWHNRYVERDLAKLEAGK